MNIGVNKELEKLADDLLYANGYGRDGRPLKEGRNSVKGVISTPQGGKNDYSRKPRRR